MQPRAWSKSPEELQERFAAAIAGVEGLEPRKMFGYPAAFVGGNLATGLHASSWFVRLSEGELGERLAAGWLPFEPMAGRPMRGYANLSPDVAADPDAAREWVERAAAYVRTLPPKAPKKR